MLPILYAENSTKEELLNTNGLGILTTCTECTVTEERNGIFECSITVVISDNDPLSKKVEVGKFVKLKANPQQVPQIFELYSENSTITDRKRTFNGRHIHYFLNYNLIQGGLYLSSNGQYSYGVCSGTPSEIWDFIFSNTNSNGVVFVDDDKAFRFTSDITARSEKVDVHSIRTVGDFLGGDSKSLLQIFKGEYKWNNFNVEFLKNRGSNKNLVIKYGVNLKSFQQEKNIEKMYTHIYPYVKVELGKDTSMNETVYGILNLHRNGGPLVYTLISDTTFHRKILELDLTEMLKSKKMDMNTPGATVYLNIYNATEKYAKDNQLTVPEVSLTITAESELEEMKNIALCDTVSVYFPTLQSTAKAKVTKAVFDSLLERYTTIELGTPKKSLANLFKKEE